MLQPCDCGVATVVISKNAEVFFRHRKVRHDISLMELPFITFPHRTTYFASPVCLVMSSVNLQVSKAFHGCC